MLKRPNPPRVRNPRRVNIFVLAEQDVLLDNQRCLGVTGCVCLKMFYLRGVPFFVADCNSFERNSTAVYGRLWRVFQVGLESPLYRGCIGVVTGLLRGSCPVVWEFGKMGLERGGIPNGF